MLEAASQLCKLIETSLSENELSQSLVDMLIKKVHIYPNGEIVVARTEPGFDSIALEENSYVKK